MGENAVNIVVVGDSIGFGLVSRSDPWSDLKLHDQYRVENHSIGGATLRDMIGVYEGGILNDFDPKLNAGGNLLIIQAGTNDLAQGRSPSELYKDAQSLAADAHSAGFKVIIATILPREGGTFPWSAASENARLEYNDLLRKGRAGADSLADIASSQTMGSVEATGNSALYSDGLHPTAAAVKAYIEPIYSLALSGNLDSGTKNDGTSSEPLGTSSPATTVPPVSSSPSLPASGTVSSNGPTTPVSTSIGTGADQLIFKVSEFVYKADAQFTVSVDGKQVGGTLTAHAAYTAGQSDLIAVHGDWSAGEHSVSIHLLADASDPGQQLFVGGATYNGSSVTGSSYSVSSGAANQFVFHDASSPATTVQPVSSSPSLPASGTVSSNGPTTPVSTSIGTGADQLIFKVSEFVYKADAQFTVSVDGKQVGGTLTAHAAYTAGQSDLIAVHGDWSAGEHSVSIHLLADASDPGQQLFVGGATYNGSSVTGSSYSVSSGAANQFVFHDASSPATTVPPVSSSPSLPASGTVSSNGPTTPVSTSIGTGADQLIFKVSEFVYKADAQFTVSVDGKQVGGTLTAHAAYTAGQSDLIAVHGDWSAGEHSVSIHLLADASDPGQQLFVGGATYNGSSVTGSSYSVSSGAADQFVFHDASSPATTVPPVSSSPSLPASGTVSSNGPTTPVSTSIGTGADQLIFKVSEFVYKADAQFTVSVDGKQVGGTLTAHAAYTAGQSDLIAVHGDWSAGEHSVSIHLLADASDPGQQLFVGGATHNGSNIAGSTYSVASGTANQFVFHQDHWMVS